MALGSPLTQREMDILKMWDSGSTLDQIGQHYGVTCERIRQILRNIEAKGHSVLDRAERSAARRKRKLDAVLAHERDIIFRLEQGKSVATIAAELNLMLGYTRLAVKQILATGKSIGTHYVPTDTTLAVWKIIRGKLEEGKSLQDIGDSLGVSKRAIVRHIRLMRESNKLPPSKFGPQPNEALQRRREIVIRAMIAKGSTRAEIAAKLEISVGTLARVIAHMRIRQEHES